MYANSTVFVKEKGTGDLEGRFRKMFAQFTRFPLDTRMLIIPFIH